jgi:hypothetical protein
MRDNGWVDKIVLDHAFRGVLKFKHADKKHLPGIKE